MVIKFYKWNYYWWPITTILWLWFVLLSVTVSVVDWRCSTEHHVVQSFLILRPLPAKSSSPSFIAHNTNKPTKYKQSTIFTSSSIISSSLQQQKTSSENAVEYEEKDDDEKFKQRNEHWVVLVDDEESIRLAVGEYLYDKGYQVTACSDADSLLDVLLSEEDVEEEESVDVIGSGTKIRKNKKKKRLPDAIISDIRMPESSRNGYQLVEEIRSNPDLDQIPVIFLTARAMTQDRVQGYQVGADAFLPKPFDAEELLSILDNLIARRQQRVYGKNNNENFDDNPSSTNNHNHNTIKVTSITC